MKLTQAASLTATFVALGLSLQAAPAPPDAAAVPPRPNVVIIMTDDQDVDSMPVMRYLRTYPEGSWVNFTNAMVNHSVCSPSRATLLTGQYAHTHGVRGNEEGKGLEKTNTLPVWFDSVGYHTGAIGKVLGGVPKSMPGWDYFNAMKKGKRDDDKYTAEAVNFIQGAQSPFLLFVGYKNPHAPAHPATRYKTTSVYLPLNRPNYNEADVSDKPLVVRRRPLLSASARTHWSNERVQSQRALLSVDDGIRQVIEALKAKGVLENTLIIFTSDNGFSWGSHRDAGKLCPYEECSNVPLLIRFPGSAGNRVVRNPVSNVDLAATIADYAGVPVGLPQDGHSYLPLLEGATNHWPDAILLERKFNPYYGVRTTEWKYVEYATGEKELYDLVNDPYEMVNRANQPAYQSIQTDMDNLLTRMLSTYSIRGFVRTADGSPIPGVLVSDGQGHESVTNRWGMYVLEDLTAGSYTVTASKSGHQFTTLPAISVPPSPINRNFVGTRVSYSVSGRITVNGQGLAGATVSAGAGFTTLTDDDGRYTLAGLPAGTRTITPELAGYGFTPPSRAVTLNEDDLTGVNFSATLLVYAVSGTITLDGQPLAGVTIADGNGHSDVTNGSGRYRIEGLTPGDHTLTPTLAGYGFAPPSRTVTVSNTDVDDIDFAATLLVYAVSGTITLDGQPLAGVTVADGNGHSDVTNGNGRYRIEGLAPGDHTLTPALAGYSFTPPSRAVTVSNADVDDIDFTATMLAYAVSGTITLDGQPLAGVTVADGNGHSDVTNGNGRYRVEGLTPGDHTLTPTLAGHSFTPASRTVTVSNADVDDIDFAATLLTYAVNGTITIDGQPLAGVTVSDGNGHTAVTDDQGGYTLAGLPPGDYSLTPWLDGYTFEPATAQVSITNGDIVQNFSAQPVTP